MRTIGILGGMSASSTRIYYDVLCELTRERLGGLHSPDLLIRSLDFAPIAERQSKDEWDELGAMLNREAKQLAAGGVDLILLATNTMHKLAGPMMAGVDLPFLHIAEATAEAIAEAGLAKPGLMATRFTMEQDFYTEVLRKNGLTPILPDSSDRAETHRIIYDELCRNIITPQSREAYEAIATRLQDQGADSLILGCTEVGMLLNSGNVSVPVFDTTRIHCEAALNWALQ